MREMPGSVALPNWKAVKTRGISQDARFGSLLRQFSPVVEPLEVESY